MDSGQKHTGMTPWDNGHFILWCGTQPVPQDGQEYQHNNGPCKADTILAHLERELKPIFRQEIEIM